MKQITNNPYRIIGILAGTGIREKTKRISRLKMLIEAEAVESDDYSFPHLGEIERTAESLDNAVSNINLDKDKLKASLFWFCSISHTDEPAFEMLKENNIDGCIEVWNKQTASGNISKTNISAYLNLSTLNLWNAFKSESIDTELIKKGINLKLKFLESDFHNELAKVSADENYKISKNEIQKIFLSGIYEEGLKYGNGFEAEFWKILKDIEFTAKSEFEKGVVSDIIEEIEKCIRYSNLAKKEDVTKGIEIGNKLLDDTEENLLKVKNILGKENLRFTNISDKVSNEASQCAIQYFNHFRETDTDPGEDAEALILRAKKVALGKLTLDRLEDNCLVINEWNNERGTRVKYEGVSHLIRQIESEIYNFKFGEKNYENALSIIWGCTSKLGEIGNKVGFNDSKYISLSTEIAREVQNHFVTKFNELIGQLEYSTWLVNDENFRDSLYKTHKGMVNVGALDMDKNFEENTFLKNRDTIRNTCSNLSIRTENENIFLKISESHKRQPSGKRLTGMQKMVRNVLLSILMLLAIITIILFARSSNLKNSNKIKSNNVNEHQNKLSENKTPKFTTGDFVKLETTRGIIKIKLFTKDAPIATTNFKKLINEGYYDSLKFAKISDKTAISLGSTTKELILDEKRKNSKHKKKGILSVWNIKQTSSGASQFIITLATSSRLDDDYFIIGEVVDGMDVVNKIGNVINNSDFKSKTDEVMRNAILVEK